FDRDGRRCLFSVASSAPRVLLIGGQSVTCDRAVVVADWDGDGALDLCTLRCSSPSGAVPPSRIVAVATERDKRVFTNNFDVELSPDVLRVTENPLYQANTMEMTSALFERVYGHGGGGGGGCGGSVCVGAFATPLSSLDNSCPISGLQLSRSAPVFLPD